MFSTQNVKISARSRKLPCKNIFLKCEDNKYTNSMLGKIMITNTSARPMCNFLSIHMVPFPPPPPYQKAVYATDEPLTEKKIVSPLRSLLPPPPPPIQNCFRRAWLIAPWANSIPSNWRWGHFPLVSSAQLSTLSQKIVPRALPLGAGVLRVGKTSSWRWGEDPPPPFFFFVSFFFFSALSPPPPKKKKK